MTIDVHHLTNDPTAAWQEISKKQRVIKITMKPPNPEVPQNKLRVVCMSDTHSLTPHIKFDIPDGDYCYIQMQTSDIDDSVKSINSKMVLNFR